MGYLFMRQVIAPYVLPLFYIFSGLILVVGLVLIIVRVLFSEGVGRLWQRIITWL